MSGGWHTFKALYLSLGLTTALLSCKKDDDNKPVVVKDYHQTAETKFIQADTVKYAYRELGNASGIPVVMISPLGGAMDDWDPAITNVFLVEIITCKLV